VLPPHELETVKVPVVGGYCKVICPETEYWPVAGAQALGVPVRLVILHRMAQFVEPVVPVVAVAEILVGTLAKLVIITMYHWPTVAPVILTCSVEAVE
jgi:hypothetical protein